MPAAGTDLGQFMKILSPKDVVKNVMTFLPRTLRMNQDVLIDFEKVEYTVQGVRDWTRIQERAQCVQFGEFLGAG